MKILSHTIEGDRIRILTDNPGRPEFVYLKDKFNSKADLIQEIEKSIAQEKKMKDKKAAKLAKLEAELNA